VIIITGLACIKASQRPLATMQTKIVSSEQCSSDDAPDLEVIPAAATSAAGITSSASR